MNIELPLDVYYTYLDLFDKMKAKYGGQGVGVFTESDFFEYLIKLYWTWASGHGLPLFTPIGILRDHFELMLNTLALTDEKALNIRKIIDRGGETKENETSI